MDRGPIINTFMYPIDIRNTHSVLQLDTPFVQVLADGKPQDPIAPPILDPGHTLDCMLCKNYHHRRTVKNLEDMERHLRNR